jgi:hypothetical protein
MRPRKRLASSESERMIAAYQRGLTLAQAGEAVGRSKRACRIALDRAGLQVRGDSARRRTGKPRGKTAAWYRLPDDTQDAIVASYRSGRTTHKVAADLSVSPWVVRMVLKSRGVESRAIGDYDFAGMRKMRPEILRRYSAGQSSVKIAETLGFSHFNVLRNLRQMGAVIRDNHECQRRYSLREDAFEVLTPEAKYWIGMLLTDGCVRRSRGSFCIGLSLTVKDADHVRSFSRFLDFDGPLIYGEPSTKTVTVRGRSHEIHSQGSSGIVVYSERMFKRLEEFGVVPRKTAVAEVRLLDHDPDFWRGAIDGDGSLLWSQRRPHVNLVGAGRLPFQFAEFITTLTGRPIKPHRRASIWSTTARDRSAYRVSEILYGAARVSLPRKQAIAQEIIRWGESRGCVAS